MSCVFCHWLGGFHNSEKQKYVVVSFVALLETEESTGCGACDSNRTRPLVVTVSVFVGVSGRTRKVQ